MIGKRTLVIVLAILLSTSAIAPVVIADSLEHGDARADLEISQPSYVESSVERKETSNRTKYELEGPTHEIRLESVNHSDVEAAGILSGSGSLEYDAPVDAWVFSAEGEAGTRVVYFDVVETSEETREIEQNNSTVTETYETEETVRYAATLSVQNVEWAHRPADVDEDLQSDAANWSSVSTTARKLDPDRDVETVLEDAFGYYEFAASPFKSFSDDAIGTVMMATTPGGLAVFGGVLGLASAILGLTIVKLHRREKEIAEVGDVNAARDEAYLEMAQKVLQQRDWEDFLPAHLARHCREYLGRNCYLGIKRYELLRSPTHTKGLLLQLMGQVGYVGRARAGDDGELLDAVVVHESEIDDLSTDGGSPPDPVDLTRLDSESDTDRQFVDLVSGDDLDVDVLYRPDDLDLEAVHWPIDERAAADSEILDAINPDFPDDFEDEEQLADVLSGLLKLVANHDFTTEDGRTRGERDLLSFLSELDSVLSDEVDFPLAHVQRRMLILSAERMDSSEELEATVDSLSEEGLEIGGDLDRRDPDDDDPGAGAVTLPDDGDDGDDPDAAVESDAGEDEDDEEIEEIEEIEETDAVDDDVEDGDEHDAPVDGHTTGHDGTRRDTTGVGDGDASILSDDDTGVPISELTKAAGYDQTEKGIERLREDAGLRPGMDEEEIASRILSHCRTKIDPNELIDILDREADQS